MDSSKDFKIQYNKFWMQYHLIARYLACPEISAQKQNESSHKLNQAEQQLHDLIYTAIEHIGRQMKPEEIEFGFFTGWNLDV